MKVIGLTGGIGTGKSTVAKFMAEMGAVVIDADKVGHEAFRKGGVIHRQVVAAFGERILSADGSIDREKLGRLVFGDAETRKRLNAIMHPAMYKIVEARLDKLRRDGTKVVVLEAPLLIEAGWTPLVDEIWVTIATKAAVFKRLKERTGMSGEESMARIRSQLGSEERARQANVIINTDCTLDEVKARVRGLWGRIDARNRFKNSYPPI